MPVAERVVEASPVLRTGHLVVGEKRSAKRRVDLLAVGPARQDRMAECSAN